ncbi:flagellar hook assembly protein FlgD [Siccirubricoccus sp. G192]|uniref:flagellar hook assembly protein FlgD n=1 Tax=Siccirubricoccus sp. G192 TaxID=2849651 RepID=UPI001C2C3CEE|nr:flagellar hook capping FlgD N-terminal domain-containing protein [Siccirubricoccus sp. G192]MBV1797691.1 flagellar hook assembly protein FlgD [Siccirubricoccus sp. G192]
MTTVTPSNTAAANAAGTTAAVSNSRATGFGGDFNTYLTLLTTQLKNQDPTKAMDAQQMTAQLVQFAQVEQSIAMNTNMSKLIGLQQAAQLTAAAPLMGRTVEVASDRLSLQDGQAVLRLPAAGTARAAQIAVFDNAGRTLHQATVALGPTAAAWNWDGKDATGRRLPDGAYGFSVTGVDGSGAVSSLEATVRARATAAEREPNGNLKLVLGGLVVGFDAVRSVDGG